MTTQRTPPSEPPTSPQTGHRMAGKPSELCGDRPLAFSFDLPAPEDPPAAAAFVLGLIGGSVGWTTGPYSSSSPLRPPRKLSSSLWVSAGFSAANATLAFRAFDFFSQNRWIAQFQLRETMRALKLDRVRHGRVSWFSGDWTVERLVLARSALATGSGLGSHVCGAQFSARLNSDSAAVVLTGQAPVRLAARLAVRGAATSSARAPACEWARDGCTG